MEMYLLFLAYLFLYGPENEILHSIALSTFAIDATVGRRTMCQWRPGDLRVGHARSGRRLSSQSRDGTPLLVTENK